MVDARHYVFCFIMLLRVLGASSGSYSPSFEKQMIEDNIKDGYWIEAFQLAIKLLLDL